MKRTCLSLLLVAAVSGGSVFGAEPPVAPPAAPSVAPPVVDSAAVEPAVTTSSAAATPSTSTRTATTPRKGAAATHAQDHIDLEATQVTGNRELPNVMYVVPWKKPDLGDFAGRPPKSLLDELLAPVDREVFQRQNRYFAALQPDAAASGAAPVAPTLPAPRSAAPVSGPADQPVSGDVK